MQQSPVRSTTNIFVERHLLLGVLVILVGVACLVVLTPFVAAVIWAAILAYASWPLYRRLRKPFGRFKTVAASLMTLLLTGVVVLPVLWMLVLVGEELVVAYQRIAELLGNAPYTLPGFIQRLPWLGEFLQQQIDRYSGEPGALMSQAGVWIKSWSSELTALAGGTGRNLAKLLVAMVTVFFLYRDGEIIVLQARRVVQRFFDDRLDPYIATIAAMTRSVVYGLVVTAFAQGLIAGIGYAIVGISAAILLGALTGILSVVPMVGTGAVWGSLSVYLALTGHVWKAVILALWGLLLVHPTDNILRPLLISNATRVPFLLVMFGVLGGLTAFGLVGALVGPIVLAVGLATWREWAAEITVKT